MRLYDLTRPEDRHVGRVLRDQAEHIGGLVWLASDDRKVTYAQSERLVNQYARGLRDAGVAPGAGVAMLMEPSIEAVLVAVAVARLGAVFTGLNTDFHTGFLEEAVAVTGAEVLVVDAKLLPRLDRLASLGAVRRVIVNGGSGSDAPVPGTSLESWLDNPTDEIENQGSWLDPVQCWWSSGTTGKPKGIVHSHSSALTQVTAFNHEYEAGEVLYSCTPMYLGSPWSGSIWTSLVFGLTAAIDARFSVSRFWDRVRHYGATQAHTLGAMHILLWKQPPSPRDTEHRLRRFVAIPMPGELIPKFKKRFGIAAMSQGYGTSETFRVFDAPDVGADISGALIGVAVPRYEVCLLDANDRPTPEGVAGEICVRPREPGHLFLGYFRDPARTLAAWSSLWHHTGDMAICRGGKYYFADRKKDYIRYKGRSLSMFEVEQVVEAHPDVVDVAAFGIPSQELESESELKVAVVLKVGCKVTEIDIARFVNEKAPYFFVPRYIELIDQLPRNAHGRLLKEDLRERGVTDSTWDRKTSDFVISRD